MDEESKQGETTTQEHALIELETKTAEEEVMGADSADSSECGIKGAAERDESGMSHAEEHPESLPQQNEVKGTLEETEGLSVTSSVEPVRRLPEVDKMSILQQDQDVESNQEETARETVAIPLENVTTRDPILSDSQQQLQVRLCYYCAGESLRLHC